MLRSSTSSSPDHFIVNSSTGHGSLHMKNKNPVLYEYIRNILLTFNNIFSYFSILLLILRILITVLCKARIYNFEWVGQILSFEFMCKSGWWQMHPLDIKWIEKIPQFIISILLKIINIYTYHNYLHMVLFLGAFCSQSFCVCHDTKNINPHFGFE